MTENEVAESPDYDPAEAEADWGTDESMADYATADNNVPLEDEEE